jgi:hypothetical protein
MLCFVRKRRVRRVPVAVFEKKASNLFPAAKCAYFLFLLGF